MKGAVPEDNEKHAEPVILVRNRAHSARAFRNDRRKGQKGVPASLRADRGQAESKGTALHRLGDRQGDAGLRVQPRQTYAPSAFPVRDDTQEAPQQL